MNTLVILLGLGVAEIYLIWYFRKGERSQKSRKADPARPIENLSFSTTQAILDEVKDQLEISVESVRFDFLKRPDKPEVQVILCLKNASRYEVLVRELCWQLTVGAQMTPSVLGVTSTPFLLPPQTFRNDLLIRSAVDPAEASYISRIKAGLLATGDMEGIVLGKVQESSFQKSFVLPSVPCLVDRMEVASPTRVYVDPTHLDPLTGLFNHKFLTDNMQNLVDLVSSEEPVSFLMIDVDNFKKINDEHGHLIGDDVLKAVSAKIRQAAGNKGFAIRYGGDEFSILLRNNGLGDAAKIAEKLRLEIANFVFTAPRQVIEITISVGVASITQKTEYKNLIQQADDRLLLSKRDGKNKVTDRAW